jgi:hypothetical protein
MDDRVTLLQGDVANIKVTLTEMKLDVRELRGKLDAANQSIFDFREEVKESFGLAHAALERTAGELRTEMAKSVGELRAEMAKGFGEMAASIERLRGTNSTSIANSKWWWLLTLGCALGFVGKALGWI